MTRRSQVGNHPQRVPIAGEAQATGAGRATRRSGFVLLPRRAWASSGWGRNPPPFSRLRRLRLSSAALGHCLVEGALGSHRAPPSHRPHDAVQLTLGTPPPPGAPPNPKLAEPPTATAPLCAAFVAVTVEPVWVYDAFHMDATCCEPGQVQVTFQEPSATEPELVTFTSALKPPPQSLLTE